MTSAEKCKSLRCEQLLSLKENTDKFILKQEILTHTNKISV